MERPKKIVVSSVVDRLTGTDYAKLPVEDLSHVIKEIKAHRRVLENLANYKVWGRNYRMAKNWKKSLRA